MAGQQNARQREPADNRVEMAAHEHHAARIPAQPARQGITLGRMRYVLALGLGLIIVAFAILYFLHP